jgi:mRNA-degrading endonuclease RelE of RelBE toxin-antitoxin system
MNYKIVWTKASKKDLLEILKYISIKRFDAIYNAPSNIVFPEQFQKDEYRNDCRRIIEGNYKILYKFINNEITIIRVFNSLHNPIKSKE